MRPFEEFIQQALRDYERYMKDSGLSDDVRRERLSGAREFAIFLVGRPVGRRRGGKRRRG